MSSAPITVAAPVAPVRHAVTTSMAGKALELLTLVLLATVVPRVLGPEAYGRFAVPLTLVTLGSLALTLGGPTVMARYVPTAPPGERVAVARALGARLARGRAVQLGLVALAAAAVAVVAPHRVAPIDVAIVLAALVLNVVSTLALQPVLGLGRAGPWSFRYPAHNAVLVAAVLALEPALGARGGLLAILLAAAVAAGIGLVAARPVIATAAASSAVVPPGAIRFGVLQAAGAGLSQVTHRGGVVAVAVLAGSTVQTGYAALAVGLALGVSYAVLQAFTVSLPHLAGDVDPVRAEAALRRLAGGLLAVIVPAAVVAAVGADRSMAAVLGDGYRGASAALVPALAMVVLAPLASLTVQAAALRLRPEVSLAGAGAGLAAFVTVAALAVPGWGAAGGTAATLAGTAVAGLVAARLLPGAAGARVVAASVAGAAAVLVAAPGWWGPLA